MSPIPCTPHSLQADVTSVSEYDLCGVSILCSRSLHWTCPFRNIIQLPPEGEVNSGAKRRDICITNTVHWRWRQISGIKMKKVTFCKLKTSLSRTFYLHLQSFRELCQVHFTVILLQILHENGKAAPHWTAHIIGCQNNRNGDITRLTTPLSLKQKAILPNIVLVDHWN